MLQIVLLWLDSYHWFVLLLIIGFPCFDVLQHKNMKQQIRVNIFSIGCESWTREQFEGQADCWEQYWFTVGIQPLLKWLSFLWYSTYSVFELWLVLKLWCLQKLYWIPIIKKRLCLFIPIKFLTNSTGRTT